MSDFEIILDCSQKNLKQVPHEILQMRNLKMLYLHQNFIKELPKNLFQALPNLTWLDLRRNHLTTLPKTIAHHSNLENLLISDNKIEALPNELGLVPKLKVLQVGNNPLFYPNNKVIAEGTKAIVTFLKRQYETSASSIFQGSEDDLIHDKEMKIEEEIRVFNDYSEDYFPLQNPKSLDSSLTVKSLSKIKQQTDGGVIHQIVTPSANKFIVKSYFEDEKVAKTSTQTSNSLLQKTWVAKLKEILEEQERVLQQERLEGLTRLTKVLKTGICRNLQALSSWRLEKKLEPGRTASEELKRPPPYATDYTPSLNREEVNKQIDKMIEFNVYPPNKKDIEKLISDLMSQLKELGNDELRTNPKAEIEEASSQILKIVEMHKRLVQVQHANDLVLN